MKKFEIMEKINDLTNKQSDHEVFYKVRPPEEFGDAVRLHYHSEAQTYQAVVFDPDTLTEFFERTLPDAEHACSFIFNTIEGRKDHTEYDHELNQTEYINIYWDEWRD